MSQCESVSSRRRCERDAGHWVGNNVYRYPSDTHVSGGNKWTDEAADNPAPDRTCDDCGKQYPVWFAPHDVWNLGMPERGGCECPSCFAVKYEAWMGKRTIIWSFEPQSVSTSKDADA